MRKKIYRISEDKFDELKPNIDFPIEKLVEQCYLETEFEGQLVFKSTNGVSIRGVVYCDNPYVRIQEPQFDSEIVSVSYTVPNLHFKVGEVLKGKFVIIAVGVEKTIEFEITYGKKPLLCSTGEINSLEDFASFAQSRYQEAVTLFYSDAFADFVADMDKKTRLLYRGFRGATISPVNVDEFLAATGLKPRMEFSLKEREDKYYGVNENLRAEIELTRSTWGYIDVKVTSDADFVSVEKENITADFFLGSVFTMNYYIHKSKMHAGINLAKISFDFRDIHKEISIMATSTLEGVVNTHPIHDKNMLILKLGRNYEEFRLRRMTTGAWCTDTISMLEKLDDADEPNNQILLYKALVYITNKQKQEALWIIQGLKRSIDDKRSFEWAFLLYLCTLIEREESYVDRITEDIESIFKEHSDDVRIFWFLLFLRKSYIKNPTLKLRDISNWIFAGNESTALYIEAYFVYIQDPYLISTFDDFTLKVLHYAKKHNAITRDMAIQMIHVVESERSYNPDAYDILESCYEVYPDLQLLLSMVTYMLKAPALEERFFKWFKMAIESNLHAAGIFEAYMTTLPSQSVEKLPQLVTMFFRYNNDLPYEKKALLYANIILHKDEDKETYEQYQRTIETFALDQLKTGHIDDNLAICYQELLSIGIIDGEVARLLSGYVFKKKVAVIYPNIRRVVLYQDEFKAPTMATVKDHQAYITYMGQEGVILLEDTNGQFIADENGYLLEDIIDLTGHEMAIRQMSSLGLPYVLQDFENKKSSTEFAASDLEPIGDFLQDKKINDSYRQSMYPVIIEFLTSINREDILEKHFLHGTDLNTLSAATLASIVDILVTRSRYEEAYNLVQNTNGSQVSRLSATKICQFMLNKKDNQLDDFLITSIASLIDQGSVHKDMIYYLIKYYVGPTNLMLKIFTHALEQGQDITEFAERILVQTLYRDSLPENIMDVFDAYMNRRTNRMIVEAFLTFEAHTYLAKGTEIPDSVFAYIYARIKRGQAINDSMRIALLKYLCLSESKDDEDLDILDMLLGDAIYRNQYFGFFSKCDRRLQIKYHLYDKHFVECRCEHHKSVVITYAINDNSPVEEDMIEMYDGLYVKEFVLFFSDKLRYEIYCDELSNEPLIADSYTYSDTAENEETGRYSLMNSMQRYRVYGDKQELAATLNRYQGLDVVVEDLFTTI